MVVIKNLEIVNARVEQCTGFFEADTVLLLIRKILGTVPLDLHRASVSQ